MPELVWEKCTIPNKFGHPRLTFTSVTYPLKLNDPACYP